MKPKHARIILKAMPFLMSNLNVDAPFLSELEKCSILTAGDIAVISKEPSPAMKVHRLCVYLMRAGDQAFNQILLALQQVGDSYVVDELLRLKEKRSDHRVPSPLVDDENLAVQIDFFELIKKMWPDVRHRLRVDHYFLAFFVSAGIVDITYVDYIMEGSCEGRAENLFSVINDDSCLRPSVLFSALEKTSQTDISQEIQDRWGSTRKSLDENVLNPWAKGNLGEVNPTLNEGADVDTTDDDG